MAKGKQEINIVLTAKDDAGKKMDKVDQKGRKLGKGMKLLAAGFAAAGVAAVALTAKLVSMAAEEEKVAAVTQKLLENQGRSWDALGKKTDKFLKKLEVLTAFNDTDLQIAFNELLGVGMKYEDAMKSMTSVTDLAAAKNISLLTSAQLLGKAYVGQTGSLSRYGIILKEGLEESEKFAAVTRLISNVMGGTAQATAQTLEGQMANLKNQMMNVGEAIGANLIPAITPLIASLGEQVPNAIAKVDVAFESMSRWVNANREDLMMFKSIAVTTFGIVGSIVTNLKGIWDTNFLGIRDMVMVVTEVIRDMILVIDLALQQAAKIPGLSGQVAAPASRAAVRNAFVASRPMVAVPKFHQGGDVLRGGLAELDTGERVLTREQRAQIAMGNIQVTLHVGSIGNTEEAAEIGHSLGGGIYEGVRSRARSLPV